MNNEKKAPVRQIKFRGLTVDTKEWVYGVPYFLNIDEYEPEDCIHKTCIITGADWDGTCGFMSPDNNCFIEVIPETVGQFTGLLDKNGKEIYEGDMVLASMKYKGVTLIPFRAYVFYNESVGSWQIKYETTTNNFATDFIYSYEIEIVGHIHEEREVTNG